jgi:CRISPR-associated protein Cmr3
MVSIKPLDVLFFRNYKPFDADEGSYGEVLSSPYPSTFYGALKTAILYKLCNDYDEFKEGKAGRLNEIIGYPKANDQDIQNGSLKITFFGLSRKYKKSKDDNGKTSKSIEILLPIPKDLVKYKDDDNGDIHKLSLKKRPNWIDYDNGYNLEYILCAKSSKKVESPNIKYITKNQLENYLNNGENLNIKDDDKSSQIYDIEYRTGIGIDRDLKITKKGYLYQVELLRLKKEYSYIVGYDGDDDELPDNGVLKVGGESKIAEYNSLELDANIKLSNDTLKNISESKMFKLYLSTPAIFDNGWRPRWIGDDLKGNIPDTNIAVKLIAASVGKYRTVGGWDIVNSEPKPSYRAVPEGSVYYFEILNDFDVNELKDALHGKAISDIKKEEGFGITYIGGI